LFDFLSTGADVTQTVVLLQMTMTMTKVVVILNSKWKRKVNVKVSNVRYFHLLLSSC